MRSIALVDSKSTENLLIADTNLDDVELVQLENINEAKVNVNAIRITKTYRKYLLQKLRIDTASKGLPEVATHSHIQSQHIIENILSVEQLISRVQLDYVCLALNEAHNSDIVPIFDAVCKENSIKTIYITHPLHRVIITDNMERFSESIYSTYQEKLEKGLSVNHRKAARLAIQSYIEFKQGAQWPKMVKKRKKKLVIKLQHYFKMGLSAINKYRTIEAIVNLFWRRIKNNAYTMNKNVRTLDVNDETSRPEGHYFVLLLNKKRNYRLTYLSPFYSETLTLIRNIAISLPFSYNLVVRQHPGNPRLNPYIQREVQNLGNVILSKEGVDYFDLIAGADITFSVASSSFFDSIIMGTPVISFGTSRFMSNNFGSLVSNCTSWEKLPMLIDEVKDKRIKDEETEAAFYSFLVHSTPMSQLSDWANWLKQSNISTPAPAWIDIGRMDKNTTGHVLGSYLKRRAKQL